MVNAISLADGERGIGIENVLTQNPEMGDATAGDGLINIHLAK